MKTNAGGKEYPDFSAGVMASDVPENGVLEGRVGDHPVLLARLADGFHAVGAVCTHYGACLADGLRDGETIRCPLHHACFSLRTGRALRAPGFLSLDRWEVEAEGEMLRVDQRREVEDRGGRAAGAGVRRAVIVGGGAAGYAAAMELRALGFQGSVDVLSADDSLPCDRPNLSKDYLAGTAPEEWIPLRHAHDYLELGIHVRTRCEARALRLEAREVCLSSGETVRYDVLLLATGAHPRRLWLPGFDSSRVHVLRSLADARGLVAAVGTAQTVAIVGGGFIALEAAAALRSRGLDVHVISSGRLPLERVLGTRLARLVAGVHLAQGVQLHLEESPKELAGRALVLSSGKSLAVDVVLVGIGVLPETALAESAGLEVDDGIVVDDRLRTSNEFIFSAGDVARYPVGPGRARVEHWVHAQRQGQVAAANMLGMPTRFLDVPFFWTQQFELELRAVGWTANHEQVVIDGSLENRDFCVRYYRHGTITGAVTCGRDVALLEIERELESGLRIATPQHQ